MKKILDCFEYLKRYQIDLFESICILLECFLLKQNDQISPLLQKAQRRHKIYESYLSLLSQWTKPTPPNPHLNLSKVLKAVLDTPLWDLGLFFDLITQKKTNNKLFFYTTPLEVSVLLNALADLKKGESLYNPCFGLGSLFLQIPQGVSVYGEELDERFVKIASLICKLGHHEAFLVCNDVLKQPSFKDASGFLQFDKIICNPPLHSHLGTNYIKEDERFSGLVSKNYPELIFFFHALVHLKTRGVFILRRGIFKNLESKLKEALLGRLECIIDLPKNIFPYQNHDFCIVIVGKKAERILYIDASGEHFSRKDGRYHRLQNMEEILEIYHHPKKQTPYSKTILEIDELFEQKSQDGDGLKLSEIAHIFKGRRVYGGIKDEKIEFYEVGVSDFEALGFSERFDHLRLEGQKKKVLECLLKPYDILISWRGNSPKITILSPHLSSLCVPNMGVIVVRANDANLALGIYAYLFGSVGYQKLCELCEDCLEIKKLKNYLFPSNLISYASYFGEIEALASQFHALQNKIIELKDRV
ncbi:N-6 DNA methylase [Helicobacter pametensis]|uniref:N-6 DNA methylase n=1 Tax=Helicobacter pametensis TaxID=95149 RepID=UPI00047FDAC0|nr:N-6 DNA methylase [Helicobacter pametensis]